MRSDEHGGHKKRKTLFVITMHTKNHATKIWQTWRKQVLCVSATVQKISDYAVLKTMSDKMPLLNKDGCLIFNLIKWPA